MNKILSCNQYRLTSIIVIINSFTAMVTVDNHIAVYHCWDGRDASAQYIPKNGR